jgi:formylglycine-generating enzyme required for sulfatase activity
MPVNSYPKGQSPFGLYNMVGNAAEWVGDWYDPDRKSSEPPPRLVDPVVTDGTSRVIRGGSFGDRVFSLTTYGAIPIDADRPGAGIRCMKDIEE